MFEKITVKSVMVAEFEVYGEITMKFEKYIEGNQVRVFENGEEVDLFTNHTIGDNHDRFESACIHYMEERFGA